MIMKLLRGFNQFSWGVRNVQWWARLYANQPKGGNTTPAIWAAVLTTILMTALAGPLGFGVCLCLMVMVAFVKGMVKLDRWSRRPLPIAPVVYPRHTFNKRHCQIIEEAPMPFHNVRRRACPPSSC